MKETGLVPLFYHQDLAVCKEVIRACYFGGVRVFEFVNRGDFAHNVFSELNSWTIKEFPDLILGIGSVIDQGTTALYLQLGANFVVSPILNAEMARVCNRRKVAWIPGCGSLTEISFAEELGAEVVKIFPGEQVGGADFIKAILGPSPWTSVMITGGVKPDQENLSKLFKAGAFCVGMGSQLISNEIIDKGDYTELSSRVKMVIDVIDAI
jgi:2-dehydro-3-deoxyphosphogluconate aldolase/(4S)-4-hydroxy-2-oxoglutarate aldolase